MSNVYLKPAVDAAGAPMLVRDPQTNIPLDVGGEWKTKTPFWARRLRDKDVIDATAEAKAAVVAATKAEAEAAGKTAAKSRASESATKPD